MISRSKLFCVLCVIQLFVFGGCSLFFTVPAPDERGKILKEGTKGSLSKTFDVLVWNIYKGGKEEKFLSEFKKYSKDKELLILQEGMENEAYVENAYRHHPDFEFFMATSFYKDKDEVEVRTGVVTGAKVKAVEMMSLKSPSDEAGPGLHGPLRPGVGEAHRLTHAHDT